MRQLCNVVFTVITEFMTEDDYGAFVTELYADPVPTVVAVGNGGQRAAPAPKSTGVVDLMRVMKQTGR